ncbi:hypothetical protein FQR65_LT05972 [Abscondita terminalis]|nr:hypothetical protein FQR65_LT05972 [Abscondita terminalis]
MDNYPIPNATNEDRPFMNDGSEHSHQSDSETDEWESQEDDVEEENQTLADRLLGYAAASGGKEYVM